MYSNYSLCAKKKHSFKAIVLTAQDQKRLTELVHVYTTRQLATSVNTTGSYQQPIKLDHFREINANTQHLFQVIQVYVNIWHSELLSAFIVELLDREKQHLGI